MDTEVSVLQQLRESIAAFLTRRTGERVDPKRVHIPAGNADAGVPMGPFGDGKVPGAADAVSGFSDVTAWDSSAFAKVCGVDAIKDVRTENGWWLFTLSEGFFDALLLFAKELPLPGDDGNRLVLNRMLAWRRQGGTGCPGASSVRRGLLLLLCAYEGCGSVSRAEKALLTMLEEIPPRERTEQYRLCGAVADGACRLLHGIYLRGGGNTGKTFTG